MLFSTTCPMSSTRPNQKKGCVFKGIPLPDGHNQIANAKTKYLAKERFSILPLDPLQHRHYTVLNNLPSLSTNSAVHMTLQLVPSLCQ